MLQFVLMAVLQMPGQLDLPQARPVPRMQVLPLPGGQASVERDGREISRYHFGPELYRPFLYPLDRAERQVADADGASPRSRTATAITTASGFRITMSAASPFGTMRRRARGGSSISG